MNRLLQFTKYVSLFHGNKRMQSGDGDLTAAACYSRFVTSKPGNKAGDAKDNRHGVSNKGFMLDFNITH